MTRTITGLMFGNNRKQCMLEMLIQLNFSSQDVDIKVNYFRKIRNKDLFEYSVIITIK
jgi:hypothetical protein